MVVQALRPVAASRSALLAAVVFLLWAAATLASVAASGEGPLSSYRKNLGQRLSRSLRIEEWPLLSHLLYTQCRGPWQVPRNFHRLGPAVHHLAGRRAVHLDSPFMEPMGRLAVFVSLAEADRLPATERSGTL